MIKRLRWILIGYILGVFTFDIVKRFLDERYGDNKAYQSFTAALASVSDFTNNKADVEVFIDSN
jgi:hypothetical protein